MLENLRSYLQGTFTRLVGNLLEVAPSERKTKTGKVRRTIVLEGPEPLESRITPTADYWTATTAGDWSNAQNWTDANGDHVVPTASSDVFIGPAYLQRGTNVDCTVSSPVAVNSLTITSQYTHTLTLNSTLTINNGGLDMGGGSISQPNGTASIYCYGPVMWYGGTIGSQTNGTGNLYLENILYGQISEDINSPATKLGDNLYNNGGEFTVMSNALLTITNNANIINSGTLYLDCSTGQNPNGIVNADGSNGVLTNNSGDVIATGAGGVSCIPVVNLGQGEFNVGQMNSVNSTVAIQGANPQNGVSFLNNGGTTTIYGTLSVFQGFTQQAGNLDVGGTNNFASITNGDVKINGGTVTFDAPSDYLKVMGNFTLDGGTLDVTVDATTPQWNDIEAGTGNITITNNSTITVNTINIPAGGMPHRQWGILFALPGGLTVGNNVTWNYPGFDGYTPANDGTELWLQS